MQIFRVFKILLVAQRYGLEEFLLGQERFSWTRRALKIAMFWRPLTLPRAVRLRLALEALGPIFVKFGQILSTRRDLIPPDIAQELAQLQDRVPPFPAKLVIDAIERSLGRPLAEVFSGFDPVAAASASVAQVHFAQLRGGPNAGEAVAIKVLRPNIRAVIDKDVALLNTGARLLERLATDGKRLRPRAVVAEFERHLVDELDLLREAANCSQLRRNFERSQLLLVPKVYWDYCSQEIMVMQRMHGTPISQAERLRSEGVDLAKLSKAGVEIFFTQVLRDGFFHADMHPGNILVATDPVNSGKYIALDFGIMGTLSDRDKTYLAINLLAFFRRDYRRVATAHLESGWVPAQTRVDELEAEVRAVCEPIFDRPLKDISLGVVLVQLFRASRRFNVEVQPQLVLLQKTLLNVEGIGRQLDPELDLWTTAKPFLERWMREHLGLKAIWRRIERELPYWIEVLPQMPRLLHQRWHPAPDPRQELLARLVAQEARRNRWLMALTFIAGALLALAALPYIARLLG